MGGVGPSAPCSVMEKKQPYAFHSWRVGAPLRSLVTERLSKKQDDSSVFIKPSFNRNLPCALHCSRKCTSPRGVQVAPDTVAASCAHSWNPFSLPAHCPALLFHVPVYCCCCSQSHSVGCGWAWPFLSPTAVSPVQSQQDQLLSAPVVLKPVGTEGSPGTFKNVQVPGPYPRPVKTLGMKLEC